MTYSSLDSMSVSLPDRITPTIEQLPKKEGEMWFPFVGLYSEVEWLDIFDPGPDQGAKSRTRGHVLRKWSGHFPE